MFRALLLVGGLGVAALVLLSQGTATKTRQPSLEQQKRRSDELDEKTRGVLWRLKRKERILQRHLAGKLTLLETAAHFRALDQGSPDFNWERFCAGNPGDSDEERFCRAVIERVRAALAGQGATADHKQAERLEAELREHLRHGSPRLPAVEALDAGGYLPHCTSVNQ
jgi:hypothetical protein